MKEKIELLSDAEDIRIDKWLSNKFEGYSRTYIQKLINNNLVTVNEQIVKRDYKLKIGNKISIIIPEDTKLEITPEKINLNIIYEDNAILVINKPKGMVVHPAYGNYTGTLVNALMNYCGNDLSDINGVIRPGIVHRLDKDTSGVLVVAKNNKAHKELSEALKNHKVKKVYVALVNGVINENSGTIDLPIGRHPANRKKMAVNIGNGKEAVTSFKVIERFADATYMELMIKTGRTHQIRVHLSYIGHPVIGDKIYGGKNINRNYEIAGHALHAKVLGLIHPITGDYMEFEADIPEDFDKLLTSLRKGT